MSRAHFILVVSISTLACSCDGESTAKRTTDAGERDSGAVPPAEPPYDNCNTDSDCAWGEIENEIERSKECTCLYGCPFVPLSKATVERRAAKYKALCDPERDGNGDLCGIDDCAQPPRLVCSDGTCKAGGSSAQP